MKRMNFYQVFTVGAVFVLAGAIFELGCSQLEPSAPPNDELVNQGQVNGLTQGQLLQFVAGDEAFNELVFDASNGLGPIFNGTSCFSCHAGDGKGVPFSSLIRFGQNDTTGNKFLAQGGPQLQSLALPGYQPEQLPPGATFTTLTPPITAGLGLIEAVPDDSILAMAAENASNPDGVRGHPNWNSIPSYITPNPNDVARSDGKYICRFGKKASVYSLLQQTVNALNQDIGITSTYNPVSTYSGQVVDPKISNNTVQALVLYLEGLIQPTQRNPTDPTVMHGQVVFEQCGCASCHRETLMTGFSTIDSFSYQQFHPFTDLLVHDMGPGLDDHYTEGTAQTSEWRTAPLWGLGLAQNSQGGQLFLLHDGRAHSIQQAIQMHGGEATTSVNRFNALSSDDLNALITFLQSL
jgi:CxxC motif-containing protein (DUF1111 family)